VLLAGHPTPDPFKFCNATKAAWILVLCDAAELSVGNWTPTVGLCTACPAEMSSANDWMNWARAGGQLQGTWIGLPSLPFTAPSQLPVPVGLTPDAWPNWGVNASIWERVRPPKVAEELELELDAVEEAAAADEVMAGAAEVAAELEAASVGSAPSVTVTVTADGQSEFSESSEVSVVSAGAAAVVIAEATVAAGAEEDAA